MAALDCERKDEQARSRRRTRLRTSRHRRHQAWTAGKWPSTSTDSPVRRSARYHAGARSPLPLQDYRPLRCRGWIPVGAQCTGHGRSWQVWCDCGALGSTDSDVRDRAAGAVAVDRRRTIVDDPSPPPAGGAATAEQRAPVPDLAAGRRVHRDEQHHQAHDAAIGVRISSCTRSWSPLRTSAPRWRTRDAPIIAPALMPEAISEPEREGQDPRSGLPSVWVRRYQPCPALTYCASEYARATPMIALSCAGRTAARAAAAGQGWRRARRSHCAAAFAYRAARRTAPSSARCNA